MKNLFILALLYVSLIACAGLSDSTLRTKNNLNISAIEPKVDSLVKQYMALDIYSGGVLIAQQGKPLYHKAFGLANREKGIANTINTHFDIGSMNKGFTKVVVLQLVNEGKLKLDDKLGKFLTGFPKEAADKITIGQLLNHQSGYGDYHTPEYWNIPRDQKSLTIALEYIKKRPLLFEPGTEQEYSNAGYVILGMIVEELTGKSYFDVVEQRITAPLKMKDTYLREKYSVPNRAIGYYKNAKGELLNNESFPEIVTPAGGFYSTTSDILKFYRAYHYGDQLWDESTRSLDEMHDFYQEHKSTGGAMTHAGGFEGANTVIFEVLRDELSVIVFANMDEVVAEDLGLGILTIIRGKQPESPSLPAEQAVYAAFSTSGPDYVKTNWEELSKNFHPEDPKYLILNSIGYDLLSEGNTTEAIAIFKLNTQLFEEIGNCWDSYGEALLKQGDKIAALAAYKKALSIDPNLPSAKEAVKKLQQ